MNQWILTYTGKRVEPLNPKVEDIDIRDIAHALSNQCRWTGHTREFFSVAQHSVLVAEMMLNRDWALHALLHDASEAYLCDIAKPVKDTPTFDAYKDAEARLMDVIYEAFGLTMTPEIHEAIKIADRRMCATEGVAFVNGYAEARAEDTSNEGYEPYGFDLFPMPPRAAKRAFLQYADELVRDRLTVVAALSLPHVF